MEQKSILISALSVGVGVGVGIGLASGQSIGNWGANNNAVTADKIEHEMLRQVIDGRESNVTFDKFPYYLRYLIPIPTIKFMIHFSFFGLISTNMLQDLSLDCHSSHS